VTTQQTEKANTFKVEIADSSLNEKESCLDKM
jgi:hypothetical protein